MLRVALLTVWLLMASSAFAAEPAFKRWAVLAQESLRENGVSDLLMAELAAKSVELVEREQLDAIAKEVELNKLLGNDSAAMRLKVGQIAKADALVLLSMIENEKKERFAKLVICDCRYGARLRLEHWPMQNLKADQLAEVMANAVTQTRAKFERGVGRIVAVSPLLSNNLSHEFDHLQSGLATVLAEAISQQPGVAVLEFEEARAIGDELGKTGTPLEGRRVPLFVEGEFEVVTAPKPDDRVFKLKLRAIDGRERVHEAQQDVRGNAAVVKWLSEEFASELLSKHVSENAGKAVASVSIAEQRRLLTERADAFSSLSFFLQAAALREAALLLDESDWEQHVLALGDYIGLINQQVNGQYSKDRLCTALSAMATSLELQAKLKPVWRGWWMSGAAHLEWLGFSHALSSMELLGSFEAFRNTTQNMINMDDAKLELRERWTQVAWSVLERIGSADAKLRAGTLAPIFASLKWNAANRRTPSDDYNQWAPRMFDAGLGLTKVTITPGYVPTHDDRDALAHLDRVMERVLRRDLMSLNVLGTWLNNPQHPIATLVRSGRIPEPKMLELLRRWSDDSRPDISIYGRTLLLSLKASNAIREAKSPRDLELLTLLNRQIMDWYRSHPGESGTPTFTLSVLDKLRPQLMPGSAPVGVATNRGRNAPNSKPTICLTGGKDPAPRMTFEPLLDRRVDWVGIKRCSDKLDVAWSYNRVVLLPVGQPEIEIVKTDADLSPFKPLGQQDVICMATGDAEFVWVGSSRSGVQVFDHQGRRLGHMLVTLNDNEPNPLPSISLPNINRTRTHSVHQSLWLHAIGAGRCFVAGKFGQDGRRWFGCLDPNASRSEWRFKSWLELKQASAAAVTDDSIGPTFEPLYFVDYREPSGQRSLLFGRPSKPDPVSNPFGSKPLAFDVATGAASIFPHAIGRPMNFTGNELPVDDSGAILMVGLQGNSRAVRQDDGSFQITPLMRPTPIFAANDTVRRFPNGFTDTYLEHDGWFYWLWGSWHRVHRQTGQIEALSEFVSTRFDFRHYGATANFGLVAWNSDELLHRLHIDKPRPAESELEWLYPFIPVARRASHHEAVTEIRKLGGEVDSVPAHRPYTTQNNAKIMPWRTAVFLSSNWKGNDEALRHLGNLFELHELFVFDAPVTDAGLATIAEIPTIRTVMLGRTKVTNAGVKPLGRLPQLTELWLEPEVQHASNSPKSGESEKSEVSLSDDCLAAFAGHRTLRVVTLIDRGFTDAALKHLEKVQIIFDVRLVETGMTAPAISDFRKLRPQVRFVSDYNR